MVAPAQDPDSGPMTITSPFPPPLPHTRAPITPPAVTPKATTSKATGSIAGWLATVGAALVLVAAVAATPGGWSGLDPAIKLAILAAGNIIVLGFTERLRRVVPDTARVLGHLGPCLVVPSGILAASAFGQRWPVALLCGGLAGAVVIEVQRRRLDLELLRLAEVIAVGVAACGVAASASLPAGVVMAAVAIALVCARRDIEAALCSAAALVAPVGMLFAAADVGPGTVVDLGIAGDVLGWAAPLAGVAAAAAAAIAARRLRQAPLAVAALAGCAMNLAIGFGWLRFHPVLWLLVPAVALLVAEALAFAARRDAFFARVGGWSATFAEAAALVWLPVGLVFAPLLAAAGNFQLADERIVVGGAATLLALGMIAGSLRRSHRPILDTLLTGCAAAYAVVATGWFAYSVDAATVAAIIATVAFGLLGSALTGLGYSVRSARRVTPIALACGLSAFLGAVATDMPEVASIALALLGGQVFLLGVVRNERPLLVLGAIVGAMGIGSLPFTSGAYGWFTRSLTPYGVTGADVNVAAVVLALLVAGYLAQRIAHTSSWLAYGPGLAVAAVHLLSTVSNTMSPARAGIAVGCGVAAVLVGGVRRLAAPLVAGTVMVGATTAIMVGPSLGKLSMWLWVALGGTVLIVAAIIVERSVRRVGSNDADQARSIWRSLH